MLTRILISGFKPLIFANDKLLPCPVTRPEEATPLIKLKSPYQISVYVANMGYFYSGGTTLLGLKSRASAWLPSQLTKISVNFINIDHKQFDLCATKCKASIHILEQYD